MKYCNHCHSWYADGVEKCYSCKTALVSVPNPPSGGVVIVSPTQPYVQYAQPVYPYAQLDTQSEKGASMPENKAQGAKKARPASGKPEHGAPGMLKLTDIKKNYKIASGSVPALKGVSLEFRKSEFVCILGQSGCGKTTLLNIIGGLDHYTSGDLVIQGISTKKYKDRDWDTYRNHRIGFIFQSYNLIPHQTVLGNVELALTIAGIDKAERRERAKKALERVGLAKELNKNPNQLSGGQMQRVAIARALVNDPDILLADEPTGALDSKTSVEVMELIKEIAKERLVIMVTHNGELAEEYASRIVRLKDGLVESDSNPYVGDMVSPKRANKAQKEAKRHRSKMSLLTSLGLSFRNLLTKKGRTIVTSIAGSIGIISVCLVLALSNGFQAYIRHTEEDMLSSSPIEISETALDISSVMSAMRSPADMPTLEELHDEIYVNSFLTSLAQGITVQNNISNDYVEYLDQGIEKHSDWFSAIRYDYGEVLDTNLFTPLITGGIELDGEMQPLQERNFSVARLKEYLIDELTAYAPEYGGLLQYVGLFENIINKMPGTADFTHPDYAKYVLSQYDILGEGHFPTNEHEAVLAVGEDNSLLDLTLVQLGFLTEAEFLGLFNLGTAEGAASVSGTPITLAAEGGESDPTRRSYERIYEQDYILYYNDAVYEDNVGAYPYKYNGERTGEFSATEQEGLEFKITAILRLKENFTYGCLSSGLNLTEAAIDTYIAHNAQSRIAQTIQKSAMDLNGITIYLNSPAENLNSYYSGSFALPGGMSIAYDRSGAALRAIGGNAKTNDVFIYPVDFDAKEHVLEYLDAWNEVEGRLEEDKITYTDRVGLMMGMVQTMLDVITYVLVAFTAISLVVSSVMIGIITYVSVVERIKEIGVLRSLGARKQDIRNLFNAETFIIGLTAGLIGIGVTYVIAFIVSMIIESLSGIAGIATLPVSTAVIMVLVSVILTLISGLIPAQAAAKKDPVIALRTE